MGHHGTKNFVACLTWLNVFNSPWDLQVSEAPKKPQPQLCNKSMHGKGFKRTPSGSKPERNCSRSSWNYVLISQCTSRQSRASLQGNANERPSLSSVTWLYSSCRQRMRRYCIVKAVKAMQQWSLCFLIQAWSSLSRHKPRTFRVVRVVTRFLVISVGSKGSCRQAATAATYTVGYLEFSFEWLFDLIWLFCFRWQNAKPCSTKLRKAQVLYPCNWKHDLKRNSQIFETARSPLAAPTNGSYPFAAPPMPSRSPPAVAPSQAQAHRWDPAAQNWKELKIKESLR